MGISKDILSSTDLESLTKKIVGFSKSEWCEVSVNSAQTANLRYAANTVTTSGSHVNTSVHITCASGKKAGSVSTNDLSDDGLKRAVARAEEIAKLAPDNEELMPPLADKPKYIRSGQFDFSSADAEYTANERARIADQAIKEAKARELIAAGFLESMTGRTAFRNSKGVFATDQKTRTTFSTTVRKEDGSSSGWSKRASHAIARLESNTAINRAVEKCVAWDSAKEYDPGVYKAILEPSATADMMQQLVGALDAREAEEGRSAFSRAGGKTAMGEQLLSDTLHLYSDPNHPIVPASIYGESGQATGQVDWFTGGKLTNFTRSRYWAQKTGAQPQPGPTNLILESNGTMLPEDYLTQIKEGFLITSFWYIRDLDNHTLLKTGLTRDGLFFVEDGKIKHGVLNFRWNESPLAVFKNVIGASKPVATAPRDGDDTMPMLAPLLYVSGFNFASISDAV
jgi:predicted Zn-dependent protease